MMGTVKAFQGLDEDFLPPRNIFDYISTRDLTSIKYEIEKSSESVKYAQDGLGYTALHTACAHGSIDIVKALLGHDPDDITIGTLADCRKQVATYEMSDVHSNHRSSRVSRDQNMKIGDVFTNDKITEEAINDYDQFPQGDDNMSLYDDISVNNIPNDVNIDSSLRGSPKGHRSRKGLAKIPFTELENIKGFRHDPTKNENALPIPFLIPPVLCDVDAKAHNGITPLHIAAYAGDIRIVKLLLEAGASPCVFTKGTGSAGFGNIPVTPYQIARHYFYTSIEMLLEPLLPLGVGGGVTVAKGHSGDIVCEYLMGTDPIVAAANGDLLYFSLAVGDAINDSRCNTAYYERVGIPVLERIRTSVMKKKEGDSELCTTVGNNVLMAAIEHPSPLQDCHLEIIRILLEPSLVFVKKTGKVRDNDAYEAIFSKSARCQTIFTTADYRDGKIGATLSTRQRKDMEDTTNEAAALDEASPGKKQAIINATNQITGQSALHIACRMGHVEIIQRLLDLGADPTLIAEPVLQDGDTAIMSPRSATGGVPLDMIDDSCLGGKAIVREAATRKTFLTLYAKRNNIRPEDRPEFSERAKMAKKQWRDAERALQEYQRDIKERE